MSEGLGQLFTDVGDWVSETATSVGDWASTIGQTASDGMQAGLSTATSGISPETGWESLASGSADNSSWIPDASSAVSTAADVGGNYDLGGSANVFNHFGTAGTTAIPGESSGMFSDFLSNPTVQQAGLKLGAQALGSLATAPGSSDMKSYLDDVRGMEAKTQAYNMNMADKKAGVGDQLAANAAAMDPDYTAGQAQTASKNRGAAQWDEQEKNMRMHGFDENAIQAEKNKFGIADSQNQGTAYDSGYQTGVNKQNATYGTAGSLYTGVAAPSAGLSTAYTQANEADSKAQQGWGNAIEQAFGVVNDTTKKPKG